MKVTVVLFVVVTFRMVSKGLENWLEDWKSEEKSKPTRSPGYLEETWMSNRLDLFKSYVKDH